MARGIKPPTGSTGKDRPQSPANRGTNAQMRSGLTLPLNNPPLAIPLFNHQEPSREDVLEGGQVLFQHFVRDEYQRQRQEDDRSDATPIDQLFSGADTRDHSHSVPNGAGASAGFMGAEAYAGIRLSTDRTSYAGTPEGYKTFDWTKTGRTMRDLADSFAKSRQGAAVREQAAQVQLSEITEDRFFDLLVGLFSDGLSTERVLTLFYFCTNLILRCASQSGLQLARYLFSWSLKFIQNRVCQWVYEHGGWNVFTKVYSHVLEAAAIGACLVAIFCGVLYIRKNL